MASHFMRLISEGRRRKLAPFWSRTIAVLVVALAAFEIYGAPFGLIDSFVLRGLFVGFALCMTFICYTATPDAKSEAVPWYDMVFSAVGLACGLYILAHGQDIVTRWTGVDPLTPLDIAVTAAIVLLTLEVTRRTVGPVLLSIILVFVAYNFIGEYLPGYFGHRGMSVEGFLDRMVYTYDGVFGTPIGVTCTYVYMFVLFGQVFNAAGGGDFFFRLAASIAGRMRGGPAKICVIASALYGSISGSPTSDVVTTGSITIPLMKRLGYGEVFAGAVSAAACSGASVMPPIMGTAAFLMVDVAGIPYLNIALAAIIPAVIYYFGVMAQVHFRAIIKDMRPISEGQVRESAFTVLKENVLYLIPIAVLLVLILKRVNPTVVGLVAAGTVVVVSWFIPGHRLGPKEIYQVLRRTGTGILTVTNASAAAGMVIGGIMLTGLGGKFTSLVFAATGGSSFLCLALVALVCIVLGMGMPVPAAYVLTATLAVPALLEFKFSLMGSHMFIVFFSAISAITPPVAVAAYAAAGISEGNPNSTGFQAVRLAVAAYLAPFVFMYRPGLLLEGSVVDIVWTSLVTTAGVLAFACAMEGYFFGRVRSSAVRLVLFAAGLVFIYPAVWSDLAGFALLGAAYAMQFLARRGQSAQAVAEAVPAQDRKGA